MAPTLQQFAASMRFLRRGLQRLDRTAALFPSSPALVEALLAPLPLERVRCVVELGPGIGPVTRGLLGRLGPNAHLHAIEIDPELHAHLATELNDPRLRPILGSAADTPRLLREAGCPHPAEAVVSSLGISMMPAGLRDAITDAVLESLGTGGIFVQYQHLHARALTWQPDTGFARFNARRYLARFFERIQTRLVLAHLPPAIVLACGNPRKTRTIRH